MVTDSKIETVRMWKKLKSVDWNEAYRLSRDGDQHVRMFLCSALAEFPCDKSEQLLIKHIDDASEWVRSVACQSLGCFESADVADKLVAKVYNDENSVKEKAFLSIAKIASRLDDNKKYVDFLYDNFEVQENDAVKSSISCGLAMCGDGEHFQKLLDSLDNINFQFRNIILDKIEVLLEYANIDKQKLVSKLNEKIKVERFERVKEHMQQILNKINL